MWRVWCYCLNEWAQQVMVNGDVSSMDPFEICTQLFSVLSRSSSFLLLVFLLLLLFLLHLSLSSSSSTPCSPPPQNYIPFLNLGFQNYSFILDVLWPSPASLLFPLYLNSLQPHPSLLCVAFFFLSFHPLKLFQCVLFCVGFGWLCIVDCLQSWFLEFWTIILYQSVTIKSSILMLGFEETVLLFATEY